MLKLLLLLVVSSTAVNCLQLERLCPADHFDYEDVRVNAIHRVQYNLTLEPVSFFTIDLDEECSNYNFGFSKDKALNLKPEL